jgi:rhodanese-related sulfurtransferase
MFFGASMSPTPPVQIQCGPIPLVQNTMEIEARELNNAINSGKPLQVLDLRHATDFPKGRIPGSISVPAITSRAKNIREHSRGDRHVVLYSWVGAGPTTQSLANELASQGFTVSVLKGGWEGWVARGWPIESEEPFRHKPYEFVAV